MKPAARNDISILLAVAFGLVACVFATPACAATRALHAWGTSDNFWFADVNAVPPNGGPAGVLTTIHVRSAGDSTWRTIGELSETPISVSNRGSELLIVLDYGEWKIASDSDVRGGISLPGSARVMALAGDGDDIWAIGGTDPLRPPSTTPISARVATKSASKPAVVAAAATTAPTTASAKSAPLLLYQLHSGAWSQIADVPVDYKAEQVAAVSLAMLDRKLTLAIVGTDRAIRLFTFGDGSWSRMAEASKLTLNDGAQMKLLDVRGKPALWLADANTAGALYYASDGWAKPTKLAPSKLLNGFDCRSLAFTLGQLRLLATSDKGRIAEQLYEPDGKLKGEANEAVTAPSDIEKKVGDVIKFIVMAALIAWMLGSLRQRPNMADVIKRVDTLHIAPMNLRVLGGLIDAVPLLAGIGAWFYFVRQSTEAATGVAKFTSPEFVAVTTGVGLYLLQVTLVELLTGRSLGKWITGTRVAALDGSPARASQLLARNALRLIDLILMGIPLLATVQSPLRQRVGDMMAATIVVLVSPPAEGETVGSTSEKDDAGNPPQS